MEITEERTFERRESSKYKHLRVNVFDTFRRIAEAGVAGAE